jgi:hypothetical protein
MSQPKKTILGRQIQPASTTVPLVVPDHGKVNDIRELLRLPKNGQRDEIFQLSRSTWNNLILPCAANKFQPPIKSISLRRLGTLRGVRLIVVASAREYFQRLIDEQDAAQGDANQMPAPIGESSEAAAQ